MNEQGALGSEVLFTRQMSRDRQEGEQGMLSFWCGSTLREEPACSHPLHPSFQLGSSLPSMLSPSVGDFVPSFTQGSAEFQTRFITNVHMLNIRYQKVPVDIGH